MNNDEIEAELKEIVRGALNTKADLEWAWETYRNEVEKNRQKANQNGVNPPEDEIQRYALNTVHAKALEQDRVLGPVEEVEVIGIGFNGPMTWGAGTDDEREVIQCFGLFRPSEPDEDGNERKLRPGFLLAQESDDVDLGNLMEVFYPYNYFRGYFTVNTNTDVNFQAYRLEASDKTRTENIETSDEQREKIRDLLQKHIEEAQIASITDHYAQYDDDGEYLADFGLDMRRIEGEITNYYKDEENENGNYRMIDDSLRKADEVPYLGDSDGEQSSPGLLVWIHPDFIRWEPGSRVEVFGAVTTGNEGQTIMNGYGVHPHWSAEPLQESGNDGGVEIEDDTEEYDF